MFKITKQRFRELGLGCEKDGCEFAGECSGCGEYEIANCVDEERIREEMTSFEYNAYSHNRLVVDMDSANPEDEDTTYFELNYRKDIETYLEEHNYKYTQKDIEEINTAINEQRWEYQDEINDEQAAIDYYNEQFHDIMEGMVSDLEKK